MSIDFLYSEHGFNLAIFGLTLGFVLLGIAIRLSRQGSEAFTGILGFSGMKLAEGFFIAVALVGLLAVMDGVIAERLANHRAY
ncbi:MAG TPA: hypothetical protein VNF99_16815, partial [Stellaceae bacterium]|nr:hypothetical protein [Stellaceae bacterium]